MWGGGRALLAALAPTGAVRRREGVEALLDGGVDGARLASHNLRFLRCHDVGHVLIPFPLLAI